MRRNRHERKASHTAARAAPNRRVPCSGANTRSSSDVPSVNRSTRFAKALGISQPAVSKILRRLGARWARENKALLDQHRFEAATTLRRLLREASEEWQRSRAAHVRKRQRKQEGGKVLSEVWIDETPGDPRFLDQIGQLLDRLALAQGLSAASQRPIVGKEYSEEFQREVATAKQRLHEQIEKLARSVLKRRARQKPGTTSEPPEATGGKAQA